MRQYAATHLLRLDSRIWLRCRQPMPLLSKPLCCMRTYSIVGCFNEGHHKYYIQNVYILSYKNVYFHRVHFLHNRSCGIMIWICDQMRENNAELSQRELNLFEGIRN